MLQNIHDKLKGWLAYCGLGRHRLGIRFLGHNWTLSAPTYAAKVTAAKSPPTRCAKTYQQQLAQMERQSSVPLDDAMRNEIKRRCSMST